MNQHWHWQTWQDRSYLTCELLAKWQHGFFTRDFYPQTPEVLTSILHPTSTAFRVKQVHGNIVLTPQEIFQTCAGTPDKNNDLPLAEADAVMSDRPNQSVWAASADCTPILIGDTKTGKVCSIHAGWRGTAAKIVVRAVSRLIGFDTQLADLRVGIGPAISGSMYQVDDAVALKVARSLIPNQAIEDEAAIGKLSCLPNAPVLEDSLPGKKRLDVPRINQMQLEQLGLDPTQIAIAPYCTFKERQKFFSYRRTGEKQVQWSGIVSD